MIRLWLTAAAGAVALGCLMTMMRMRQQMSAYQRKNRQLKETILQLEQQLRSNVRLDALLSDVNEPVLRIGSGGATVVAANPCARIVFEMGDHELPLPMRQLYRDADWNALLLLAVTALPEKTKLPRMQMDKWVLTPRLAQLDHGEAMLLCLDVTRRHKLEQQQRTFLSNLMHDLKTPLTSLLGYARSMECFGDQADFRKEAAVVIADEAKHVNHLLNALLTLDQAEFGQRDDDVTCDMNIVVRRVCGMLTPQCSDKHVKLKLSGDKKKVAVAASFEDVDRIVTNLLVNAINYSPQQGRIRVVISRRQDQCRVVIEDEGPGIAEKHLPHVTERFYRVDKARSRTHKSHGLGLAIVKELLEFNGGELTLSNRDPNGLHAEFTLPLQGKNQSVSPQSTQSPAK